MCPPVTAGAWDTTYHAPVLAAEVSEFLAGAARVLDGTLGGGGHSALFLAAGANVTAIDRDPEAIAAASARLAGEKAEGRFRAYLANYADLDDVTALRGARFDGILLDLGISSHQIDVAERGFSFREGAPLDMRMAGSGGDVTAADLLNDASESELARVFREYGDEPRGARLAREVARRRATRPFATSDDFVGAIRATLGPRSGSSEFARLFQALRIAVNAELEGLERALPALRDRLTRGGTLAVISYHSGEDRVVKHRMREWSQACTCPPKQPMCTCGGIALGALRSRRPIVPGGDEVARNPRARSARLRAWRSAR